jgi:hypothetical protein
MALSQKCIPMGSAVAPGATDVSVNSSFTEDASMLAKLIKKPNNI